jgi:hypothetical protein
VKREQAQVERYSAIERENFRLLQRFIEIDNKASKTRGNGVNTRRRQNAGAQAPGNQGAGIFLKWVEDETPPSLKKKEKK